MHLPSRRRRGAAIVEFALVFLLFLMMTVGLFEFGRAMWTYTTVAQVARATARYLVVHGSINPASSDEIKAVLNKHSIGLEKDKLELAVAYYDPETNTAATNTRGSAVEVQVRYPFQLVAGPIIFLSTGSSTIQMRGRSRAIVAN